MKSQNLYLAIVFVLMMLFSEQSIAGNKIALVIGVSRYESVASLDNPVRDADLVASSFRNLGFDVTELRNDRETSLRSILDALAAFRTKANGADAAIIYFAGHGVEVKGTNWLLPSDVSADTPEDLEGRALKSTQLAAAVRTAAKVRLVVLDACRNNPFERQRGWSTGDRAGSTSGLGKETSLPDNVVILLATQPGRPAVDGKAGGNSPFAAAFAKTVSLPNLQILSLPARVAEQMRTSFGVDQRPDQQGYFADPRWNFGTFSGAAVISTEPNITATAIRPVAGNGVAAARTDPQTARMACIDTVARPLTRFVPEAAIPACRRAVELLPQDTFIRMQFGRALVSGGDYIGARDAFARAADEGNAWAMVNLGALYRDGRGSAQDPVTALAWFEKAAALGNHAGMFNAALINHLGKGMGQSDFKKAFSYYEVVSKVFNYYGFMSLWNIGVMYNKGQFVERNFRLPLVYWKETSSRMDNYVKQKGIITDLDENNPFTHDIDADRMSFNGRWGMAIIK